MNHVSIFEKRWLELVFEGRNKQYGAYRLRLENPRTTVFALLLALLLMATAIIVPVTISKLLNGDTNAIPDPIVDTGTVLQLTDIKPQKPDGPAPAIAPVKPADPVKNGTPLIHPVVSRSDEAEQDILPTNMVQAQPETGSGTINGTNPSTGGNDNGSHPGSVLTGSGEKTTDTPNGLYALDKQPAFPGGIDKFREAVGSRFRQPDVDNLPQITVIVAFVIEKDGSLTDIKVMRDPGYGMGAEAIRVLTSMKTKWEPGMIKGQPVRTAYSLPITLQIK